MLPQGHTGRRRHYVLRFSVRPSVRVSVRTFVCYKICQHDIFKTNEPILIQLAKGNETINFGVRISKFKVIRDRRDFEAWRKRHSLPI